VLRLRATEGPSEKAERPSPPAFVEARSEADRVELVLRSEAEGGWVQVFRNGRHLATLPAGESIRFEDESSWIRPGLGYRYEARAVDAFGLRSEPALRIVRTPPLRPDLVVEGLRPLREAGWTDIRVGERLRFVGEVLNRGRGPTPPPAPPTAGMWNTQPSVTFAVNDRVVSWGGWSGAGHPLEAGGRRLVEGDGGPHGEEGWTATAGSHIVRAEADDINRIPGEHDESNNLSLRSFTVGEYPGRLELSSGPAPAAVDLSAEGRSDWVHFGGWAGKGTTSRKAGASLIGPVESTGEGHLAVTGGSPVALSWSDGAGIESETRTHAGLWANGVGNGFRFELPAGAETQRLRVYVSGIEGARGRFSARLSDGSAPELIDRSWNGNQAKDWAPAPGDFSAFYELDFKAAGEGERLTVEWVLDGEPNRFLGQIRLQAVSLSR